jgi:hypothetical protein
VPGGIELWAKAAAESSSNPITADFKYVSSLFRYQQ